MESLPQKKKQYNPIASKPEKEVKDVMTRLSDLYSWPPINTKDDDEIEQRIDEYLNWCVTNQTRPSMEGVAVATGLNRTTIWRWGEGLYGSKRQQEIIQKAKAFITMVWTDLAVNAKVLPATWIFYMKNYGGMKDQIDHVVSPGSSLGETLTIDELKDRVIDVEEVNDEDD